MEIPKVGDKIYIPSELYIGHGEDDIAGGVATVSKIDVSDCPNEYNRIFISVKELPGNKYNYLYLKDKQEELRHRYGDSIVHSDPDYHTY